MTRIKRYEHLAIARPGDALVRPAPCSPNRILSQLETASYMGFFVVIAIIGRALMVVCMAWETSMSYIIYHHGLQIPLTSC